MGQIDEDPDEDLFNTKALGDDLNILTMVPDNKEDEAKAEAEKAAVLAKA